VADGQKYKDDFHIGLSAVVVVVVVVVVVLFYFVGLLSGCIIE
jgi:hypothetical protein